MGIAPFERFLRNHMKKKAWVREITKVLGAEHGKALLEALAHYTAKNHDAEVEDRKEVRKSAGVAGTPVVGAEHEQRGLQRLAKNLPVMVERGLLLMDGCPACRLEAEVRKAEGA